MRYEKLLYHISRTMLRNGEDCADAVQEALFKAWQNRDKLRSMDAFRPWLTRILVNVCQDMLRRRARDNFAPLPEDIPVPPPSHDALELEEALNSLTPEQRLAVVLHYLEGWSVKEIAEMHHIPSGTVKTRLMYARKRLGSWLSEEGRDDL